MSKSITQFCLIIEINGILQPTPIAVSDDPASPDFFHTVLSNHPGAKIKVCTNTCSCVAYVQSGAITPAPNPPTSKPPPKAKAAITGMVPGTVSDHCITKNPNAYGVCPADATCLGGKVCAAYNGQCRCVPPQFAPTCGNNQLDAGEACDPPGSGCAPICMEWPSGSGNYASFFGTCNSSCACEYPTPGPGAPACIPNSDVGPNPNRQYQQQTNMSQLNEA